MEAVLVVDNNLINKSLRSSGNYNIFVDAGGEQKLVGSYNNEGSFGELALMYNMPRAATIQVSGTKRHYLIPPLTVSLNRLRDKKKY